MHRERRKVCNLKPGHIFKPAHRADYRTVIRAVPASNGQWLVEFECAEFPNGTVELAEPDLLVFVLHRRGPIKQSKWLAKLS